MSRTAGLACGAAGALGAVPVALTGMGWPAFAGVVLIVLIVVAAGCWVVADSGRARRLTTLISAWRGSTAPALTRAQTTRSDGRDRPHSQR